MELIDKIKSLFLSEETIVEPTVELKFKDAKLVDGTIVRVEGEEFKVGDKLSVITESGEIVNAPVGMHELEDGTVLVVDGESKITEVRTPEVKTEEMAEVEVEVEPKAEEGSDLEARVAKLEEAIAMLIEGLSKKETELATIELAKVELETKLEEIEKTPIVTPTSVRKFEGLSKTTKTEIKTNPTLLTKIQELREKNK